MKNRRIYEILGILLIGFFVPAVFGVADNPFLSSGYFSYDAAKSIVFSAVYWVGNMAIFDYLRKKYPTVKDNTKRLIFQFLLITVFSVAFSFFGCRPIVEGIFNHPTVPEDRIVFTKIGLGATYFVIAIYEGIFFFHRWRTALLETEQLKREKLISQFEALKQQISPHFLFNTLNTLITLIPEDPEKAVTFTEHLSKVYRYVLTNKDLDTIEIEHELKFVESFFFLNKLRFGDHLRLTIDGNDKNAIEHKIAPLSLQILIENAIKHNEISNENPLNIKITVDSRGRVTVRNDLQHKRHSEGTKIGLQNIISRYKLLGADPVIVDKSDSQFIVTLPGLA